MSSPPAPADPPRARPGRDAHLPPRTRRILHLDVDAFLASVEQALHPELRGRPVVVGGMPDSRNLVMSCSYEARAHGVHPGMLSSRAARLCPGAVFRDGDSQAANRMRDEVTRLLLGFTPRVEVASIDDFFVDLTGGTRLLGDAAEVGGELRRLVQREVGLPLTVGVGTSRTLARLAGKLAKPGGVAEVLPGHERAFLARLPVRHLPGVGHVIGRKLEHFAIRTVGELALVSREVLFASFGSAGLVLYERARGHDPEPVEATHHLDAGGRLRARPPRSIRRDSTFEPEEGRREHVAAMLAYLVERAAHRLRAAGLVCGSLEVRLLHVDTRPAHLRRADPRAGHEERWLARRARPPGGPTCGTDELLHHARALLEALPRRRALVKRVGITLSALRPAGAVQGQLFSDPTGDRPPLAGGSRADRARRLDATLDALRARHGFGRVLRGASLLLGEDHPLGPDGYRLRTPSLNQ